MGQNLLVLAYHPGMSSWPWKPSGLWPRPQFAQVEGVCANPATSPLDPPWDSVTAKTTTQLHTHTTSHSAAHGLQAVKAGTPGRVHAPLLCGP